MLKTVGNQSTRSGDQTIVDGNLIIATAGKGIDFSATAGPLSGATMTSELFDDYEEGIFKLTITDGTNNANMANAHGMYYTKLGQLVTCTGWVYMVSPGSISGPLFLSGLPFVNRPNSGSEESQSSVYIGDWSNLGIGAGVMPLGFVEPGEARVTMKKSAATTAANFTDADIPNNYAWFKISFSYTTAS